jgi:predicted metal-dependent hydrolase
MEAQLDLGEISVDVEFKDIKNIHLSVYPPTGRVRIAAPQRMQLDTVRVFAISKLDWIRRQQTKLHSQQREGIREYLDGESHYFWGKRYLLKVLEVEDAPNVQVHRGKMVLQVRPRSNDKTKGFIIARFYREQIKLAVPLLIAKWEPLMRVTINKFYVRQMKTRWGSCNPHTSAIRLNTELAKKPKHCLEYIVVHEIVHLLEQQHNDRFIALMNKYLPRWRQYRDELNQMPLGHEQWTY